MSAQYKFLPVLLLFLNIHCFAQNQNKPNIVWIVCEDISPTLSMYGDTTAKTPNLDALASESLVFEHAYATVGVCAPSRSSIITGMSPTSIGTMHMRTGKDVFSWGKRKYKKSIPSVDIKEDAIRQYSTVIPDFVKCFPEYLRAEGYYCTNNQKTDYQFAAPITAWDENNAKAHWRNKPKNAPFFSVFNFGITHESRLWLNKDKPLTVSPQNVPVPPYLPDNDITRTTIARHYSNLELLDKEVQLIIDQLKEDGLYDNTIIFFYSDHGGPLPRQKREILDSGLKVPFFVKDINSKIKGRTDQLISFVDLAPTILSISGIQPPDYMQGNAFLGKYTSTPRAYVYGSSDRFDEQTDRIRSVRNKRFLYLRNYFPELPKYKDIAYRKNIPMMHEMLSLKINESLSKEQLIWFGKKTTEELYDCVKDPFNLHNLAADVNYQSQLVELRTAFFNNLHKHTDLGLIPEAQLIEMMWPDNKQPETSNPVVRVEKNMVSIASKTKGASIAYKIADNPDEKFDYNSHWKLYTKPLTLKKGMFVYALAERIGYKESNIVIYKMKK